MSPEQVLQQFQATGVQTCFHDRHLEPQIYAGLNGTNWRLADYEARGGYKALRKILSEGLTPDQVIAEVKASGLRGRGGAGFPTGIKWKTVLDTTADRKYIVCNADEGDSGTFADRMIMEGDPFVLIEGMTIAGIAVGATYGYIYIRSGYPDAIEAVGIAVRVARSGGR